VLEINECLLEAPDVFRREVGRGLRGLRQAFEFRKRKRDEIYGGSLGSLCLFLGVLRILRARGMGSMQPKARHHFGEKCAKWEMSRKNVRRKKNEIEICASFSVFDRNVKL